MKMKSVLMVILLVVSGKAFSWVLFSGDVINKYEACSWTNNGNGTSTIRIAVDFKEGFGILGWDFKSRGLMIYTYDKNGRMKSSSAAAKSVSLNGSVNTTYFDDGLWVMYHNYGGTGPWVTREPFIANFEVLISDEVVKDWPAVSLRAANFTGANNVAENTGGVYVSKDMTSGCKVIDPETPPPPDIGISMSAPDWNLGELPQGTQEKQMSNSADRLCFTYSGAAVGTKNFTIDAISQNGRDGTKFRLRNLADTTQIVPYDVKLEGAGTSLMLPNTGNVSLKFDGSGKTCFTPTFRTTVDKTLKPGDYSDVLTFTVVTKS